MDATTVKVDTKAIPKVELRILCSTLLEAVERFYENPANAADFEAWRETRCAQ